jgi:hypothetical protein
MSGNVITETWLAWALDSPPRVGAVDAAMGRVAAHYGSQLKTPPPLQQASGPCEGLALWRHEADGLRWPAFAEADGIAAAYASVPVDWRRVVDEPDPARAAISLARELAAHPERVEGLSPPLLLGVREQLSPEEARTTILCDFAGAGRLFEMRFEAPEGLGTGGWVWSNRLGALPIFAGRAPEPDHRSWMLFAAAGWFISDTTPIAGAQKVQPAQAIRISSDTAGARVERLDTGAVAGLVGKREEPFADALERAAADARALAAGIGAVYAEPVRIDLSGGRDSRVSAAAAVAAGIDCEMRTGDNVPGELEIARELIAAAPVELRHMVSSGESGQPEDELADRLDNIHLVHDGMRNPQEIRRPMPLPLSAKLQRPTMSGHGGEIGHGFYYTSAAALQKLRKAGDEGLLERMQKAAMRKAPAAKDEAYEMHREEILRILNAGRAYGIEGPALLDWFYLAHRLAYRSGLGARSNRYSGCATPGFVRAAFDLTPEQRLDSKLHRELIPMLVPQWERIGFLDTHDKPDLPDVARDYIWDKPGHAEAVGEIISRAGSWTEIFERRKVRKMWKQARNGKGHRHYEPIFNRVAWRDAYDEHLATLGRAARSS